MQAVSYYTDGTEAPNRLEPLLLQLLSLCDSASLLGPAAVLLASSESQDWQHQLAASPDSIRHLCELLTDCTRDDSADWAAAAWSLLAACVKQWSAHDIPQQVLLASTASIGLHSCWPYWLSCLSCDI